VQAGRLHYVHNYVGRSRHKASTDEPLKPVAHELRFEFEPTGQPDPPNGKGVPGRLQLYVYGELVASADTPVTTPLTAHR
jgi:hypothetical protein